MTSLRRRRWLAKIGALASATAALIPSAAHAEDVPIAGGAGLYLNFTFGEDRLGFGYGLEGHFLALAQGKPDDCSSQSRAGVGGVFQLGGINLSTLRFVAAAQGGGEMGDKDAMGLLGELGLVGHFGDVEGEAGQVSDSVGLGLHTGLLLQTPLFATAFARAEILVDEYSIGAGVRVPHSFGMPGLCIDGRPLRDAAGNVTELGDACIEGESKGDEMRVIAGAWAQDAQTEAASIQAFLQLALELVAHDAPAALIEASLDAARDEVRHALLCAKLATDIGGARVTPQLPPSVWREPVAGREGLVRLAVESWLDGCLSEGAAAARARHGARGAEGGAARVQRTIARDEARHASLG